VRQDLAIDIDYQPTAGTMTDTERDLCIHDSMGSENVDVIRP
jgi:hypothetical protein